MLLTYTIVAAVEKANAHAQIMHFAKVGARECEPARPCNKKIVSFRACARARGPCPVISELNRALSGSHLLFLSPRGRILCFLAWGILIYGFQERHPKEFVADLNRWLIDVVELID